jgi:hypothetical protein
MINGMDCEESKKVREPFEPAQLAASMTPQCRIFTSHLALVFGGKSHCVIALAVAVTTFQFTVRHQGNSNKMGSSGGAKEMQRLERRGC